MKILALDSSGMTASVAIVNDDMVLGECSVTHRKTHSQTLLPMVDQVVTMTETDLGELDAIAIAAGPGSFTGLRIGSATAKGLAMGIGCPIIEVPTLEAMAYQAFSGEELLCPMLDARRGQVFAGLYGWENGMFRVVTDQMPLPVEELVERVNGLGRKVIFLGDGALAFRDQIQQLATVPFDIAPPHAVNQRAAAVASRALAYYQERGEACLKKAEDHAPVYLRLSQAERVAQEKAEAERAEGRS